MKRKEALAAIAYAGYHGDAATAARIYVEHRISFAVYLAAARRGQQAKRDGKPCGCAECQQGAGS